MRTLIDSTIAHAAEGTDRSWKHVPQSSFHDSQQNITPPTQPAATTQVKHEAHLVKPVDPLPNHPEVGPGHGSMCTQ